MAKCSKCEANIPWISPSASGLCNNCEHAASKARQDEARETAQRVEQLAKETEARAAAIMLTTETAHSLPVTERLGIVAAEVVIGMHIFRDIGAIFRDVFGGRSQTMQKGLKDAREAALSELRMEAAQLGADAVVAIDLDYSEISGGGKSMLFLVASGTAVRLAT